MRGYAASGYPLFPSTIAGLECDWKVPASEAHSLKNAIIGWARFPGPHFREVVDNWAWLQHWAAHTLNKAGFMVFYSSLLISALVLFTSKSARFDRPVWKTYLICFTAGMASTVFWFFTAPDPRFLGGIAWACSIFGIAIGIHSTNTGRVSTPLRWLLLANACICVALGGSHTVQDYFYYGRLGLAKTPTPSLLPTINAFGLQVWIPASGGGDCWDGSLPSTPKSEYKDNLVLRGADLRDGFRLSKTTKPSSD
jgi:hypothetical protein